MMKRIFLSMMLILSFIGLKAQPNMEMPLNPQVLHGVLPNGLTYYILHNEEPKNRANFYIAQKVGSSLETPEQLGLAHFLEHMAFNGTKHYPGKDMLNYLESKGIRFGADINAYTSFDETVYNINNVPTNDKALMDSVLLVLHDWSGSILLEEDEINAERGVIQGEYTMRNDASTRMFTAILPGLYEEYQYQQMPIGKMEIVKNFPPEVLRAYYKKWYRPDLQGIVIVGDFDAAEMEQKVKQLFADIEMPANAAERIYPTISDNEKPIYVTFEDPELQMARIQTFFKYERTPKEFRNTVMAYLTDQIVPMLVEQMIDDRLSEYAQKPDCPYAYAGVDIGTYLVSSQKGSFNVMIVPKSNYTEAYEAAMGIIVRACKTGFMGTEVQRVRDQVLASFERMYNEKDKTNSETLARELIRNFIDNEASPGIENEYMLLKQILPTLPEELLNEYAAELIHINNVAVVVTQPSGAEWTLPAEQTMLSSLNNVINADYEPYVDEVITEPLIAKLPKEGKIVSEKTDSEMGTKEYMLSNGVKVIVKATDFANDEVLVNIFRPGGFSCYPESEYASAQGLSLALEACNIGPFNPTRLGKYLAGKKVGLSYGVGRNNDFMNGSSTVKDINSLFELIYAAFTDVTPDNESYEAMIGQFRLALKNAETNPQFVVQQKFAKTLYPNSKALWPLNIETLNAFDYNKIMNLYHESVKNAADYTLIVVGNVDENTLKPLLTQYIATLPSTGKKTTPKQQITTIPVAGKITDRFDIPAQNPSVFVRDCVFQTGLKYSVKNSIMVDLIGDILGMIYTETLREEMGGTYSPDAVANLNPYDSTWQINWFVVTNEEVEKAIVDRANEEFNKLMTQGTDMKHFAKVREAAIKQYENSIRDNNYWLNALLLNQYGFNDVTGHKEALESLTLEEFNKFVTSLYDGKNKIELIGIAK